MAKGLTRWYPRHVNPIRNGGYECLVRIAGCTYVIWPEKLEWDGRGFLVPIPMRVIQWRGMTKAAHIAALREKQGGV